MVKLSSKKDKGATGIGATALRGSLRFCPLKGPLRAPLRVPFPLGAVGLVAPNRVAP